MEESEKDWLLNLCLNHFAILSEGVADSCQALPILQVGVLEGPDRGQGTVKRLF